MSQEVSFSKHPDGRGARFLIGACLLTGLGAAAVYCAATTRNPVAEMAATHHSEMALEQASGRPVSEVSEVSCTRLPDIPGKTLHTLLVKYPPDALTPAHRHPGTVTAFVITGTVRSLLGDAPAQIYKAGQTWFEPPGTIHRFVENASSTEPASMLAIQLTDDDCGPLLVPLEPGEK